MPMMASPPPAVVLNQGAGQCCSSPTNRRMVMAKVMIEGNKTSCMVLGRTLELVTGIQTSSCYVADRIRSGCWERRHANILRHSKVISPKQQLNVNYRSYRESASIRRGRETATLKASGGHSPVRFFLFDQPRSGPTFTTKAALYQDLTYRKPTRLDVFTSNGKANIPDSEGSGLTLRSGAVFLGGGQIYEED